MRSTPRVPAAPARSRDDTTPPASGSSPTSLPPPGARAGERVLLFDGTGNLCSGWARFLVAHDREARLQLATLQSAACRRLLAWFALPTEVYDSVVFVEDGRASVKSTAVVRLLRCLPWPWSWQAFGSALPRSLRDRAYDFVARHRFGWFGRRATCMLPSAVTHSRFLDLARSARSHRTQPAAIAGCAHRSAC